MYTPVSAPFVLHPPPPAISEEIVNWHSVMKNRGKCHTTPRLIKLEIGEISGAATQVASLPLSTNTVEVLRLSDR